MAREQLRQPEHRVQAFPPRLGNPVELDAGECEPVVITGRRLLPVPLNLAHQPQVGIFLGLAVQQAKNMNHGHVHLVRAGVVDPLAGVQEGRAHQVRGTARGAQGIRVSRIAIPKVHRQHAVIVAPQVPAVQEVLVGEGTEIAVAGLGPDQVPHDPCGRIPQSLVVRQAAGEDTGGEILAYELARPGHRILVRRFSIAQTHHFEHCRVGIRNGNEPVADDAVQASCHGAVQGDVNSRHGQVWRGRSGIRCFRSAEPEGRKVRQDQDRNRVSHSSFTFRLRNSIRYPSPSKPTWPFSCPQLWN